MASNRSSQVTSLSGRVQGLKFMQRATAKAPSTPVSAVPLAPSSVPSTPAQADEEHWVLPAKPGVKQGTSKAAKTVHEPAWDAWMLGTLPVPVPAAASSSTLPLTTGAGTRRTFGAWARNKRARKEAQEKESEVDEESASDQEEKVVDVKKRKKQSDASASRTFQRPGPPKEEVLPPGPLRAAPSKKARKLAAGHEAARQAAHQRKLADKGGATAVAVRKEKANGKGALKREEEVNSDDDEALQGWEDEA